MNKNLKSAAAKVLAQYTDHAYVLVCADGQVYTPNCAQMAANHTRARKLPPAVTITIDDVKEEVEQLQADKAKRVAEKEAQAAAANAAPPAATTNTDDSKGNDDTENAGSGADKGASTAASTGKNSGNKGRK